MSGLEVVFIALGILAVASGFAAVTSRQVVHTALWLVAALGSLAGIYLVLGAEVVALVQLLVYVGAVVVLVLFALMLTKAPIGHRRDLDAPLGQRIAAILAGGAVAVLLGGTLLVAVGDTKVKIDSGRGGAHQIAQAVFGGWVLPFELLSVLLLAALVAALAVSRRGMAASSTSPAPGGAGATPREGRS